MKATVQYPIREPGLSESLPGPRDPHFCQSCGIAGRLDRRDAGEPGEELTRWREHGPRDEPTNVVVVLCKACGAKRIKPHPRLYTMLWPFDPWPGAMAICADCRHRDGTRCSHPNAKANGGEGVMLTAHPGPKVHLNYGGGRGEWRVMWNAPPSACKQKEPQEPATPPADERSREC